APIRRIVQLARRRFPVGRVGSTGNRRLANWTMRLMGAGAGTTIAMSVVPPEIFFSQPLKATLMAFALGGVAGAMWLRDITRRQTSVDATITLDGQSRTVSLEGVGGASLSLVRMTHEEADILKPEGPGDRITFGRAVEYDRRGIPTEALRKLAAERQLLHEPYALKALDQDVVAAIVQLLRMNDAAAPRDGVDRRRAGEVRAGPHENHRHDALRFQRVLHHLPISRLKNVKGQHGTGKKDRVGKRKGGKSFDDV
ncbi:MAG: hypothetical protein AAFX94_11765, partial [Myxococcota bacterium]